MPGFDNVNFNHLADQLDDEAIIAKLRKGECLRWFNPLQRR